MARSARRIGNQTVLPQFWRKCSPTLQKTNLPQKRRQIMAEGLFVVFSLQDRWRSSQTCFLAQFRSGGLAIKLEGCPDVSQVSNFKKGSFIFWYLTTSTLLPCDKYLGLWLYMFVQVQRFWRHNMEILSMLLSRIFNFNEISSYSISTWN